MKIRVMICGSRCGYRNSVLLQIMLSSLLYSLPLKALLQQRKSSSDFACLYSKFNKRWLHCQSLSTGHAANGKVHPGRERKRGGREKERKTMITEVGTYSLRMPRMLHLSLCGSLYLNFCITPTLFFPAAFHHTPWHSHTHLVQKKGLFANV